MENKPQLRSGKKTEAQAQPSADGDQAESTVDNPQPAETKGAVSKKTKHNKDVEQSLTMSKSEFDQMRSDQMALLSKFDQMLTKMTNMDETIAQTSSNVQMLNKKVGQVDSKVEQTVLEMNALQKSLEIRVKQEVMETTKEIVDDLGRELTEQQEALRDKLEENWKEKVRDIHRICEQKNEQHMQYLDTQSKFERVFPSPNKQKKTVAKSKCATRTLQADGTLQRQHAFKICTDVLYFER